MKFWEIFRFELAYQVRRIWPWLILAALLVFAYLFTREGSLSDALHGDFFLCSPFVIVGATVTASLIWLLVAGVIAGESGARDVATGVYPLAYTAPVSKSAYLGGRFLAAFVLSLDPACGAGSEPAGRHCAWRTSRRCRSVSAGCLSDSLRLYRATERLPGDGGPVFA